MLLFRAVYTSNGCALSSSEGENVTGEAKKRTPCLTSDDHSSYR